MNVKELIALLEKLPQDLPIRLVNKDNDEENIWVVDVEVSKLEIVVMSAQEK